MELHHSLREDRLVPGARQLFPIALPNLKSDVTIRGRGDEFDNDEVFIFGAVDFERGRLGARGEVRVEEIELIAVDNYGKKN